MDIYTYLFKNCKTKKTINFEDINFKIKIYNSNLKLNYDIDDWCKIIINRDKYYSEIECYKKEYSEKKFNIFLKLIDIINRYYYLNYTILKDNLVFKGIDFITVNTLSGLKNPYIDFGFKVIQKDFPYSESLDLIKSNTYYYNLFYKENITKIINLHIKEFIKILKKNYKKDVKSIEAIFELEEFDYILKDFIIEKANLKRRRCFNFFYYNMGKILDDLELLPKNYIYFY